MPVYMRAEGSHSRHTVSSSPRIVVKGIRPAAMVTAKQDGDGGGSDGGGGSA